MSELREEIHKNDFLMDKVTKDMFFVIKIDMHTVWIREEKDAENDNPDIFQRPKHLVNRSMIKVNPDVIKVLYGDRADKPEGTDPNETAV